MTSRARLLASLAALALTAGVALPALAVGVHPIPVASDKTGDTLAVFYSGDGGWGSLDQGVARHLADNGVPTVGFNSLAYFSTRRSPDRAAQDLADALRQYQQRWDRQNIVLIGYSFGADALPAIVPRLPDDVRTHVSHLVLIGTGRTGDLRFTPGSWLNIALPGSYPVRPAIGALTSGQMAGLKVTCVYGDKERADICPTLPDAEVAKVRLHGGHHFNGDYASLGAAVLEASR
jgi:type IV secretory pathway VirJ component